MWMANHPPLGLPPLTDAVFGEKFIGTTLHGCLMKKYMNLENT
jgi:hypothetical protein